jgi:hypothetical protein
VATPPYFSVATLAQDSWAFAWMNVQLTMPIILIGISNGQIWLHPKRNNLISAGFPVVMVFPPKMGRRFSGAIFLGTLFPDKLMS